MIPTISTYLYRIHHEKEQMLVQHEKRRALLFSFGIAICITTVLVILRG